MNNLKRILPLLGAILCLLIYFHFRVENFLTWYNMVDLAQQITVNAILAFGMTLTILIGGIDLSMGALLALVGVVTAFVLVEGPGAGQGGMGMAGGGAPMGGDLGLLRLCLAVGAGLCVAAVFGAFNGICAATTRMPPFIITLATMLIARGTAYGFNKAMPLHIPEREGLFLSLGNGRLFAFLPVPVLVMLAVFAAMAVLLHRTRFGQHLYAIGGNREAARFTGIPLVRRTVSVYVIASLLVAVAGMIHASQLYSAEPASGQGFELNAVAAAVVGGTSFTGGIGTMWGTLAGAVIIGILDKGLNQANVHFSLQYIVKGLVILGAVWIDVRRGR